MKTPIVRPKVFRLAAFAALVAVLAVGAILSLRGTSPTSNTAALQHRKGDVLMEGVDINSNGPGHPRPDLRLDPPSGSRRRFPPELGRGQRP
jgi:hypothetical protein